MDYNRAMSWKYDKFNISEHVAFLKGDSFYELIKTDSTTFYSLSPSTGQFKCGLKPDSIMQLEDINEFGDVKDYQIVYYSCKKDGTWYDYYRSEKSHYKYGRKDSVWTTTYKNSKLISRTVDYRSSRPKVKITNLVFNNISEVRKLLNNTQWKSFAHHMLGRDQLMLSKSNLEVVNSREATKVELGPSIETVNQFLDCTFSFTDKSVEITWSERNNPDVYKIVRPYAVSNLNEKTILTVEGVFSLHIGYLTEEMMIVSKD